MARLPGRAIALPPTIGSVSITARRQSYSNLTVRKHSTAMAPRVVLGLMTFGPPGSEFHGTRVTSLETFNDTLDYFQSKGYNEVDTARMYVNGLQEGWTRQAKWQERGLKLATKAWPFEDGDHAPEKLRQFLEKSLSELGSEQVDIFYLHRADRSVPFEDTLRACNDLYQEGKFKQLGVSNYAAWEVAEMSVIAREHGWIRPTVYQAMYNAITRGIEEELIPCCRKFRIKIIAYNPVAGGLLSGKYKSKDAPSDGGRFSDTDPRVGKMYRDRYLNDSNLRALQMLEPAAKEHGLTLLQIAFRWSVYHSKLDVTGGGDGIVLGVSSLDQLKANLKIVEEGPLPDAVVDKLDEVWAKVTKISAELYWR
ncbi:Aldo/keto reductase [Myriangium duriaei CBS 260.36]|uniref:Aldo/keto reductase n=1 Tax=Myriangium duriaei CBS 260.36 TaxID=1168546 RepID=A0A9P4MI80_9PEZI|nr:Aldo/keto reductase [Myriangium duriaei CBS 260.36]